VTPLTLPRDLDATLILIRHGESTWIVEGRFQGRADPPLSPRGEQQADLVAARLAAPTAPPPLPLGAAAPTGVWHSPLSRTRQTAERIAAAAARPLHPLPSLMEIAQGEWEGLHASEVRARYGDLLDGWRRDPTRAQAPGGEPLLDAAERVRGALKTIISDLADAPADALEEEPSPVAGYGGADPAVSGVVVAHDGVLRLLVLDALGVSPERFWSLPFVLCGISLLEIRGGHASLRAHNLAAHLAPLAAVDATAAAEASGDRKGAL
jgi:probable phosphoglycerate mutase